MKKVLPFLIAAIIMLTLFSGCSEDSSVVLFFAADTAAKTFDPQIADDTTSRIVTSNCFEGLVRHGENGEVLPGVAERWTVSEDGLTYTFYLRSDAVWHLTSNASDALEGRLPENFDLSVTADDFVFGLTRALDPLTNAPDRFSLSNILYADDIISGQIPPSSAAIKAIDRNTLEIKLKQRDNDFLSALCEPVAMPCSRTFFEATDGRYGRYIKYLLSNGPFYLSFFDEKSCRINKAPDYCGASPATPDAVWLYYVTDSGTIVSGIESGEYSAAYFTPAMLGSLGVTDKMTVVTADNAVSCLVMNTADKVFQNDEMRLSFYEGTDSAFLASLAGKPAADSFVPGLVSDGTDLSLPGKNTDTAKASAHLKTALSELGTDTVDIAVTCSERYADCVRRYIQQWQQTFGISIVFSVRALSESDLKKAVASGDYSIALITLEASSADISAYFSNINSTFLSSDTAIAKTIDESSAAENGEIAAFASAVSAIDSMHVIIPCFYEQSALVMTDNVSGIDFSGGKSGISFINGHKQ